MPCDSITTVQSLVALAMLIVLCVSALFVLALVGKWIAGIWRFFFPATSRAIWLVIDGGRIRSIFDSFGVAQSYCQSMAGSSEGELHVEQAVLHSSFEDMTTR
jgi:hypothetical protein